MRNPADSLTSRRRVELLLPEFLVLALEYLIARANAEVNDGEEDMDLSEFMTTHFVGLLDPKEVAVFSREIPGFEDALLAHLMGIDLTCG